MKLVIQIPCLDEEAQLPVTIRALPRTVPGFDSIDVLVIDDGSRDRTSEVARQLGATVVRLPKNRGLAHAFKTGIDASLARGADVVVNTDADNQYFGGDIVNLVAPIVSGVADVVIGARPIKEIASFSLTKKLLQRIGSAIVRFLSGAQVADVTSGFRALSREAALRVNVFSRYTYTLETIVQAANRGLRVVSVPIHVNPALRGSRLIRSNWQYLRRSAIDLVRVLVIYRPFRAFMLPALVFLALGTLLGLRFVYYFFETGGATGHIQSLIFATIFYGLGTASTAVAFLGDSLAINRRLLEELQLDARRARFSLPDGSRLDGQ